MAISLPIVSKFDDKGVKDAESGLSKLGKGFLGLAAVGAAADVATAAVGAAWVVASAKQLMEIEKLNAQTEAVIASTGGAAGKSLAQINKLNASLEKLTGIEAEVIQEGQNMLLTFTQIKGDQFDEATKAALNLSVALGKDMASSAMLVGKALNDPIAGLSALSRAGIQFTDDQKATIASLVELGDVAGAQTIILGELERQFGGSAEAFGETTAGKIEKVKNLFGEMGETIAASLMPAINDILPQMSTFIENLVASPEFKQFIEDITVSFNQLAQDLPGVVTNFSSFVNDVMPVFNSLGSVAASIVTLMSSGFKDIEGSDPASTTNNFASSMKNLASAFDGVAAAIRGITSAYNSLPAPLRAFISPLLSGVNFTNLKMPSGATLGDSLNRFFKVPQITSLFERGITGFFPGQAEGGITTQSGLSWVGEKGPELLNLPRGAQVIPLDRMGSGGGNTTNVSVVVNAGMGTDGAAVGEQIVNAIRKYERTSGAVFAKV
jgi:hypothetical protein